MIRFLLAMVLCLCPNAYADFNTGDTFGKGMVIQANGVTQTGGGRTLNFASGTTVTVNNSAYQITASGGSSSGNVGIGTINRLVVQIGTTTTGTPANINVDSNSNLGISTTIPNHTLEVVGSAAISGQLSLTASGGLSIGTSAVLIGTTGTGTNIVTSTSPTGAGTWTIPGLRGSTVATGGLTIQATTANSPTSASRLIIQNTSGTGTKLAINVDSNSNVGIGTSTGSGALVVMGGNTGIGSLSPGQLLDITGTVRTIGFSMTGSAPATGYVLTSSNSAGDATWSPATGGSSGWTVSGNNVYETAGGNVGIGTTILTNAALMVMNGNVGIGTWKPSSLFVVGTNNPATAYPNNLSVSSNGTVSTNHNLLDDSTGNVNISGQLAVNSGNSGSPEIYVYDNSSNPTFQINNDTVQTLNNVLDFGNGNMGIGSTNPGQSLDVQGTIRTKGFILSTSPSNGYVLTSDASGKGTWSASSGGGTPGTPISGIQYNNGGSFGAFTTFTTNGTNVGIGTAGYGNRLTVMGNIGIGTTNGDIYLTSAAPTGGAIVYGNVGVGTWTPTDNLTIWNMTSGGATINSYVGGIGGITSNTSLMLHFDGPNGSTTFTDSSLTPKTVTRNGSPTISTAQAVFGQSGIFASASSDYLSMATSANWNIFGGTGAIEFRVRFTTLGTVFLWFQGDGSGNVYNGLLYSNSSHKLITQCYRSGIDKGQFTAPWTPSANVWYAVDIEFTPSTVNFFVDGTQLSTTQVTAWNSPGAVTGLGTINGGDAGTGFAYLDGYLDEYRFTNGVNNSTGNYTVPTTPYSVPGTANSQLTFKLSNSQTGFIGTNGAVSNSVQIGQGASVAITIPSSENVGIGSTNPGKNLDVQGTVRFSGNLLNTASSGGIGWSEHNAANQACNTTCGTSACVIGLDAGTVGVLNSNFVACTDASADDCVCAGP